ncbi:MAG TPA: MATE family efflux transporter [Novosphingobium sp.]|nr:MATE family efflux transporter [Novosphingobium sp.]
MPRESILPAVTAETPARAELRATVALALPLAGANLLQMAVYAVDVVFVARLGPEALAASSLSVSLVGLLMWTMTGLVGAAAPLIAAELGRRRHAVREVRRSVRMAGWMGLAAGLLVMAVCSQGETFMLLTGQDPKVAARAGPFLAILSWCAIPSILAALLRVYVSALGRAGIATAITALALAVNCLGNYAFVFGHFGAPALGLEGSAISSVVTSFAMFGAYMAVIKLDRRMRRYRLLGRWWRLEWRRLRELLRIGLPIAGTILAEAGLFSGAAFLMGRIGEAELAGHTVALQFAALAFQVPFGIAQATTIRVGYFYGAGDREGIARAGNTGIALGIGFMGLTALVIWGWPRAILHLYVDPDAPANAAMVGFALQYMVVAAAFQLFDGAQAVAAGALRGLQDTRVPMGIAVFGYWGPGIGTAILLGFFTAWQGLGVWLGLAVGLVVVASLLLWRWRARERLGLLPA